MEKNIGMTCEYCGKDSLNCNHNVQTNKEGYMYVTLRKMVVMDEFGTMAVVENFPLAMVRPKKEEDA